MSQPRWRRPTDRCERSCRRNMLCTHDHRPGPRLECTAKLNAWRRSSVRYGVDSVEDIVLVALPQLGSDFARRSTHASLGCAIQLPDITRAENKAHGHRAGSAPLASLPRSDPQHRYRTAEAERVKLYVGGYTEDGSQSAPLCRAGSKVERRQVQHLQCTAWLALEKQGPRAVPGTIHTLFADAHQSGPAQRLDAGRRSAADRGVPSGIDLPRHSGNFYTMRLGQYDPRLQPLMRQPHILRDQRRRATQLYRQVRAHRRRRGYSRARTRGTCGKPAECPQHTADHLLPTP